MRSLNSVGVSPLLHFLYGKVYLWPEVMTCEITYRRRRYFRSSRISGAKEENLYQDYPSLWGQSIFPPKWEEFNIAHLLPWSSQRLCHLKNSAKRGNAKECSNYFTIAFTSHTSKVMLKILQARLQQYMNRELPDVQVGFRKGRGSRDQIANICWIIEKARDFQKNVYFCFIDYVKAFHCMDHNKWWKILQEMGIPDHLTCLLRNLYAGQEATVRTGHRTRDWFQIEKGVRQGCILSPCLFNLYAEYIMWNARLDEHKLESRLPREISIASDMQMTPPLWQKMKN